MVPLYRLLRKYSDRPRPDEMITIRFLLEDLMYLKDDDHGYRMMLMRDIRSFGVKAYIKDNDNQQFTEERWLILYKTMHKVFKDTIAEFPNLMEPNIINDKLREKATKLYYIDLSELSPEITTLFINLIENLSSKSLMDSEISTHILDFFAMANIMVEDGHDISDLIDCITRLLVFHDWTDGGFYEPPDQEAIVRDLRALSKSGVELPI